MGQELMFDQYAYALKVAGDRQEAPKKKPEPKKDTTPPKAEKSV